MKKILIIACFSIFLVNCASNKSAYSNQSVKTSKAKSAESKEKKSRMNCRRGAATTGSNLSNRNCKKR